MSYNKYNTRNSGRFNTPGQFVVAGEGGFGGSPGQGRFLQTVQCTKPQTPANNVPNQNFSTFQMQTCAAAPPPPPPQPADAEVKMEQDVASADDSRPPWMKARLQGVKKISNKERRRRQNENLRRLLTPKSAIMVLNEIIPKEQVSSNQITVETTVAPAASPFFRPNALQSYCADLTLEGNTYKGYGETKLLARNAAAEQAVRDLILRKMSKVLLPETDGSNGDEAEAGSEAGAGEEETLPMIQLASFALHKLFSEWEYEGHKVPQLRTPQASVSESADSEAAPPPLLPKLKPKPPKVKVLPDNAATMHPSMLLAYMRPQLEYRELAAEGSRPQNMLFTMGIDVDGTTYVGKAANKKEARKMAARAACAALFGVHFDAAPAH